MKSEIMDQPLDEARSPAQFKMGMHAVEDLQPNLMNELIVLLLEGTNLQIKEVVSLNEEMVGSIYLKRNETITTQTRMMDAAHHVQLKMNTIVKMVQKVIKTIEPSVEMVYM